MGRLPGGGGTLGVCGVNKSSGCGVDEGKIFWAQKSKSKCRVGLGKGRWKGLPGCMARDGEAVREEAEVRKGQTVEVFLC